MAADYFLKLDPKIEGEATDGKHKGEIELESWSFGVSNASSVLLSGGLVQASVPGDFYEAAGQVLAASCASRRDGRSLQWSHARQQGGATGSTTITLSDVYIAQFQSSGQGMGCCRWSRCH